MNDYSQGCAWVDNEYVPIGEAKISLLDSGFSRSDVTYDVVGVWQGKFFRLDDHLDRFEHSYRQLHLDPGLSRSQLKEILHRCVARSGLQNAYVDMIVTRGSPSRGSRDPRTYDNRFYAYAIPYVWIVEAEDQLVGSHLVIAQQTSRIPEQSVDPTVKNFHWGDMVRGMFEAYDRGGTLVVLPDQHGCITEGPGFNIFVVHGSQISTPSSGVLEGITRSTVVELAGHAGLDARMVPIPVGEVTSADEVFMTSTAGGVMPVTMVDGAPIGDGVPGPITMQLRAAYWDAHDDPRWTTPVTP